MVKDIISLININLLTVVDLSISICTIKESFCLLCNPCNLLTVYAVLLPSLYRIITLLLCKFFRLISGFYRPFLFVSRSEKSEAERSRRLREVERSRRLREVERSRKPREVERSWEKSEAERSWEKSEAERSWDKKITSLYDLRSTI